MQSQISGARHKPKTRQTELGVSGQGQLIMQRVRDHHPRDDGPRAQSRFLKLPDELLAKILEFAVIKPKNFKSWRSSAPYDHAIVSAIAFTCKRFHRHIVPYNYSFIGFEYPKGVVPPSMRLRLLHRTLQSDPSLGSHCRELSMHVPDVGAGAYSKDPEKFAVISEVVQYLTKVRSLKIHGGFGRENNKDTWQLLRICAEYMGDLECVVLSREALEGLEILPILKTFQKHSLKELTVNGIAESSGAISETMDSGIPESNIQKLGLNDYMESPENLARLLSWPKGLESLRFGCFYSNRHYMDLPMFVTMLSKHKETLEALDIGYLSFSEGGLLGDFRSFESLKSLTLSRWSMAEDLDTPEENANLLLVPNLEAFGWDFTIYDQHSESWSDFGEKEERWLRVFAQAALNKESALREIRVTFCPDPWSTPTVGCDYPWDRLARLRDEFESKGIVITYSDPPISKDSWLGTLAGPGDKHGSFAS